MSGATPYSVVWILLLVGLSGCSSQSTPVSHYQYELLSDLLYRDTTGINAGYIAQRCRLDLYYPIDKAEFTTIVWFHAGGLSGGEKWIPPELQDQGWAVAAVNYRLHPQVQAPVYIEDAAAAVAWVFTNIADYGGARDKIIISGHSAGGYLTSMVGLDKRWLAEYGIDADSIAALVPFSGHAITHFTVRKERGIEGTQAVVDDLAPIFHVRANAPEYIIITGDRDLELLGRYEENAYMWRMMLEAGHTSTAIYEMKGADHGGMVAPGMTVLTRYLREKNF
jgi:acetyl esterase/lipase